MSNYLRIFVTCSGYDSERKISFNLQHDGCKSLVVKRSPWTKGITLQCKFVEEGSNFESEILPNDYTIAPTALHTFFCVSKLHFQRLSQQDGKNIIFTLIVYSFGHSNIKNIINCVSDRLKIIVQLVSYSVISNK